jgi:uncharacterized protein (TIGR03083 family)
VTQPSRQEAVRILEDGRSRLVELLAGLSGDDLIRPSTIGSGDWSAKDLIGHVAFWEELALKTMAEWRGGEKPEVEQAFASGGPDDLNAENYERKRDWPLDKVRAEAEETHRRLIREIEEMSDQEWTSKAPYETERRNRLVAELGSVLGAPKQPFGHAFAHIPDLEAYASSVS